MLARGALALFFLPVLIKIIILSGFPVKAYFITYNPYLYPNLLALSLFSARLLSKKKITITS